jgi:magnesium and cobalt transporter
MPRSKSKPPSPKPLRRIAEWLHPGPDSNAELLQTLARAQQRGIIKPQAHAMLEGVLGMAALCVADVMVAAPRMDVLDISANTETLLHEVIEHGHSRFPVFEGEADNIIGILLAKDLLKLQRAPELNVRTLLRPASFVPESKNLHDMLRQFRDKRQHLAMVVDEFGRVAGLITIEDVLEQIVGDIEDEFDTTDTEQGVIFSLGDGLFRVRGDTPLDEINAHFSLQLPTNEVDTIGGLVAHQMRHVPRRGEEHKIDRLEIKVLHTKAGAVQWLQARLVN